MNSQLSHQIVENPFTPDRPVWQDLEFIGREDDIDHVREAIARSRSSGDSTANAPFVICGPPGIGKTSLLYRLANGTLPENASVLYADFSSMDPSSLSIFLWQLAKAIMGSMTDQGLVAPQIEKRMLILNPELVFRQRFWTPLLSRAHSTPLVLAWDNIDALSRQGRGNDNLPAVRTYLYHLLQTNEPVHLLLTITGRLEAVGKDALSPFRLTRSHRLANLNKERTVRLIQRSDQMNVIEPVADFIFELTNGHPGDTHRLCHSLYERHNTRGHVQLTIADVIAVLQHDLQASDFFGRLYHRLQDTQARRG